MNDRFGLTPAVKNLLIINVLAFAASYALRNTFDANNLLGLHYFQAQSFGVWQFVTYMFLHGDWSHLFFNMFAVFMFGRVIEQVWGTKKFLVYYFATGIGAGIVQQAALWFDVAPFLQGVDACLSSLNSESLSDFLVTVGQPFSVESQMSLRSFVEQYDAVVGYNPTQAERLARTFLLDYQLLYIDSRITIGASGAVFGLLLAFGMLFPNMQIMLLLPPIPIKAKYMVIGYGVIELFAGVANTQFDNVAHWAHLGGMLFGFILIKKWKERSLY